MTSLARLPRCAVDILNKCLLFFEITNQTPLLKNHNKIPLNRWSKFISVLLFCPRQVSRRPVLAKTPNTGTSIFLHSGHWRADVPRSLAPPETPKESLPKGRASARLMRRWWELLGIAIASFAIYAACAFGPDLYLQCAIPARPAWARREWPWLHAFGPLRLNRRGTTCLSHQCRGVPESAAGKPCDVSPIHVPEGR